MFGMLSVLADFERSIIVERVRAGMQRAKAQGTRRAERITDKIEAELRRGGSVRDVAEACKVGVGTVHRVKETMSA